MKISTRSITLAATLTAMCFVTGLLPYVFFLPVTVAATTLSVGIAAFVGFAFGAVSVAYSFLIPTGSFVGVAFMQAPYVAIIPRVLAALGAFGAYKLIEHIAKPQKRAAKFAAVSASDYCPVGGAGHCGCWSADAKRKTATSSCCVQKR